MTPENPGVEYTIGMWNSARAPIEASSATVSDTQVCGALRLETSCIYDDVHPIRNEKTLIELN